MPRVITLTVLSLLFGTITGCLSAPIERSAAVASPASADPVLGTWTTNRGMVPVHRTFHADGTYIETFLNERRIGTWRREADRVTWTIEGKRWDASVLPVGAGAIQLRDLRALEGVPLGMQPLPDYSVMLQRVPDLRC